MPVLDYGIEASESDIHGFRTTKAVIKDEDTAKALGKAPGIYITIDAGDRIDYLAQVYDIGECVAEALRTVLLPNFNKRLCICGLGNRDKLPDSLGPEVTRRLPLKFLNDGHIKVEKVFHQVCAFNPGVLALNGVTTDMVVEGMVNATGSDCILLIDSLVTQEYEKFLKQIQISTADGATPFLGTRKLNWSRLGVPIITVGVPIAMPSIALTSSGAEEDLLTCTDISNVISAAAKIIAYAILRVCWPSLSPEECYLFTPTEPISLFGRTVESEQENIC